MKTREHFGYLTSSAWSHLRPKRPFLPREDWIRIGGGIIAASVVGWFISQQVAPAGAVLVNVGSFFGALVCLLPRHHDRLTSAVAGLVIIDGGAVVGVLLRHQLALTLVLLFFGLFAAGMARAVSIGAYMRLLFAAVAVCAVAELSGPATRPSSVWLSLGAFVLGQLIVVTCACAGRSSRLFSDQREAVAELYRQLIVLAEGGSSRFVRARTLARESLELIAFLRVTDARWLRTLVDEADEIAANVAGGARQDDVRALRWVLQTLSGGGGKPLPDGLDLSAGVALALEAARGDTRTRGHASLRTLLPADTIRFLGRELRDVRGSTFRFALRVALTGVICQAVGLYLVENVGNGLPSHGFWTLLAGCLMAMPDYHGTSGKAIARTVGSVVGAVLGTALSLVVFLQQAVAFQIVITLLVLAYLAARTMSQGVLMLVVVTWIAFLLGGEAAAFTRTLDTIIGAVIAAAVFFILPTWNVDRLLALFRQWCVQGRSALSAALADAGPGRNDRVATVAFTDLAHAQRRFARAAMAVPLEPRKDESPWPVDDLPQIADTLDRTAVAVLQMRRSSSAPAPGDAAGLDLVESFGAWFDALAAQRPVPVPVPEPFRGTVRVLWREMTTLERLAARRG